MQYIFASYIIVLYLAGDKGLVINYGELGRGLKNVGVCVCGGGGVQLGRRRGGRQS